MRKWDGGARALLGDTCRTAANTVCEKGREDYRHENSCINATATRQNYVIVSCHDHGLGYAFNFPESSLSIVLILINTRGSRRW
jgi:hypothetical protein